MSSSTVGSRDDTSFKLRSQNQQILSKEQTKLLEAEAEKMAERLSELKIAMSREKEERERTFRGGFWETGQAGSLGSYPKEVLSKSAKSNDQTAKRKITLLKDDPVVLPERNKGPGSMALMVKQQTLSGKSGGQKVKGRRCGQCEEKSAHVSCIECGEDYCASCFAAFHLKGALKKHRSTPIGAAILRTPRAERKSRTPNDDYKENIHQGVVDRDGKKISESSTSEGDMVNRGRGLVNSSKGNEKEITLSYKPSLQPKINSPGGGTLLEGMYDPVENQRQFQEALLEWRHGGKVKESGETSQALSKTPQADVSVETATEKAIPQAIDIIFNSSSMTYAERLMLKKHRRMELGPLPSSSHTSTAESESPASPCFSEQKETSRVKDPGICQSVEADVASPSSTNRRLSSGNRNGNGSNRESSGHRNSRESSGRRNSRDSLSASRNSLPSDSVVADSVVPKSDPMRTTPVNRKAVSARVSSDRQKLTPTTSLRHRVGPEEPKISIMELRKSLSKRDVVGLERSTTYHVLEIPDPISATGKPKQSINRRISSRPRVRKDAFMSTSGSEELTFQPRPPQKLLLITQTSVEAFDAPKRVDDSLMTASNSLKKESVNDSKKSGSALSQSVSVSAKAGITKPLSQRSVRSEEKDVVPDKSLELRAEGKHIEQSQANSKGKKALGLRTTSRAKLQKCEDPDEESEETCGNPAKTSTLTKSASRPGSRKQNQRPKSQTGSRPSSRMTLRREGCITKASSEALRSVARMADPLATSQRTDLGTYFMLAVKSDQAEVVTPVSARLNSARDNGRWRVSNSLYQIVPRSWKPDTSLAVAVSDDQVQRIVKAGKKMTENTTLEQSNGTSVLNWSLRQGLSTKSSVEKSHDRVTAMKGEAAVNKKIGGLEISPKISPREVKFYPGVKSSRKADQSDLTEMEGVQGVKLNFSQNHSITPNMMIPQHFRRPGSGTAGPYSTRSEMKTGRESRCGSKTGRESQMIVYEGDDLSIYDEQDFAEQQREIDAEMMKRLEVEIASETGLMASETKGTTSFDSQMEEAENMTERKSSSSKTASNTFHKLRESLLMNDFEEMEAKMMEGYEEEVKALK